MSVILFSVKAIESITLLYPFHVSTQCTHRCFQLLADNNRQVDLIFVQQVSAAFSCQEVGCKAFSPHEDASPVGK